MEEKGTSSRGKEGKGSRFGNHKGETMNGEGKRKFEAKRGKQEYRTLRRLNKDFLLALTSKFGGIILFLAVY